MTELSTTGRGERRRLETRGRLVAAARELIIARGVSGLRIADLTDTADVGRGSFYNHFASREELVDAVVGELIEELAAGIVAETGEEDDAAVAAARADRRFIGLASTDPGTARLFVNLAHADTIFEEAVRPYARIRLERGVTSGRFRMPDVDLVLIVLIGSALALMRAILDGRAPAHAEELHAEAMLVLFGVPAGEAHEIAWRPLT